MKPAQAVTSYCSAAQQLIAQLAQDLPASYQLVYLDRYSDSATVYDSFDDVLWHHDQLLIQAGCQCLLLHPQLQRFALDSDQPLGFLASISNSALRRELRRVPSQRRLLPLAQYELQGFELALVNSDAKTCARLYGFELQGQTTSATYLELHPLRGYQKATKLLKKLLQTNGCLHCENPADFASLLKVPYHRYSSSPAIPLAADLPMQTVANRMASTFVQIARRNESGIIDDIDSEFLHDYRVSLRRVRSLLALFKGVGANDQQKKLRQRLAKLMRNTNALRDLDVHLQDREACYSQLPKSLHPGLDQVFTRFVHERSNAHQSLCQYLGSSSYRTEIAQLQVEFEQSRWLENGRYRDEAALNFANRQLRSHFKRVCRIASSIDASTVDETIHDLRLECKKLRYLLSFFAPLYDRKTLAKSLKPLKRLQNNLGRFNDYSSQQIALRSLLAQAGDTLTQAMIESIGALVLVKHQLQLAERTYLMANIEGLLSKSCRVQYRALWSHAPEEAEK